MLGCTKVPGVNFMDNFSGVAHDVTLRMALITWTVCGLDVNQLDVEMAFLEGELNEGEHLCMSCPMGMELNDDECLELGFTGKS